MMKDRVIITQGQYAVSAVKKEQYPQERRREIVFMGRSNVGKSSLINSLTRVKNLARVSAQPGKTQTINFYEIGAKIDGAEGRRGRVGFRAQEDPAGAAVRRGGAVGEGRHLGPPQDLLEPGLEL